MSGRVSGVRTRRGARLLRVVVFASLLAVSMGLLLTSAASADAWPSGQLAVIASHP
jgi:hypothetical protein